MGRGKVSGFMPEFLAALRKRRCKPRSFDDFSWLFLSKRLFFSEHGKRSIKNASAHHHGGYLNLFHKDRA
jgi:hypothetical protein